MELTIDRIPSNARRVGETCCKLILYVAGVTPKSLQAVANLRRFCEDHLNGEYEIEVVDVFRQPDLAGQAQIVAVPTLVRQWPLPSEKLVGDLSCAERILIALGRKSQQ